jgi:cytochrome c556
MTIKRISQVTVISLAAAAATLAYAADATNPPVKARQEAMDTIGKNTKLLSQMAKGERAFDAGEASAAVATIGQTADKVPDLFKTKADDPESTAKDAIWDDYDDFTKKVDALKTAATEADMSSLDSLKASLMELGKSCKSCHDDYREKK